MKKFTLKPVVLALGLSVFSQIATAALIADKAVVKNDGSERVTAKVSFPTAVTGDLYVATQVNGHFFFLTKGGAKFTQDPVPLAENTEYLGVYPLFDFSGADIAPGRYPLYQVVTQPGTDPLDFTNWVGGLAGLHAFNFSIGLSPKITNDLNGDGFADDDLNHDGFHDDDVNRDGFHDSNNADNGNNDGGLTPTTPAPTTPAPTTPTTPTVVSKSLYSTNCSQCHGVPPRYNGIFRAVHPAITRSAINRNKGGMGYLKFLTDTELESIASYLRNPQ